MDVVQWQHKRESQTEPTGSPTRPQFLMCDLSPHSHLGNPSLKNPTQATLSRSAGSSLKLSWGG